MILQKAFGYKPLSICALQCQSGSRTALAYCEAHTIRQSGAGSCQSPWASCGREGPVHLDPTSMGVARFAHPPCSICSRMVRAGCIRWQSRCVHLPWMRTRRAPCISLPTCLSGSVSQGVLVFKEELPRGGAVRTVRRLYVY